VKTCNIFCASNPARLADALLRVLARRGERKTEFDFSGDLIFLPSRRAIRTVEKMLSEKSGGAVMLPRLAALGEEPDNEELCSGPQAFVVSNTERVIVLAKLLSAAEGRGLASVLPVARDLVRMQDYIENEAGKTKIDWRALVDEKYAGHFQKKAEFLSLSDKLLPDVFPGKTTEAGKRNSDIREWISFLRQKPVGGQVIVCGSTASIPATADLMEFVEGLDNGRIILPGKPNQLAIEKGCIAASHPYYSEMKFLERVGVAPDEVQTIDVGGSSADFLNSAFSNKTADCGPRAANQCARVDCARESEEAEVAAEIAARAVAEEKSVLVITPDSAGNQRLRESMARRGLAADFSGGVSGAMTRFGRAVLNGLDMARESKVENLLAFIDDFNLDFSESDLPIIEKLQEVSNICIRNGIMLNLSDARAVVADALSLVQIRPPQNDDAKIRVLGTIESRMQFADVVILTGLNEGMFPASGYENPWLPRAAAQQIGLPPPERKVSLMALDFINLSCGPEVYWLRSRAAGGVQTTESRFLSRIGAACPQIFEDMRAAESIRGIMDIVRSRDDATPRPLDYSPPRPPADRSPVYVTELELLIHNPYAFYAKHILRLRPKNDWWAEPGAKEFGTLVHEVIQHAALSRETSADAIIKRLDAEAKKILRPGCAQFHFWHKRFLEMAPAIARMLADSADGESEKPLRTTIAGRTVKAIADRVWDGHVLDIKTGAAPSKKQLAEGNMPQLPLEAHMLGGAVMQFLQLQNNNVKLIEYSGEQARVMINAAAQKISELFGRYSKDAEPYEHYENTDAKYKAYDDLARVDD
jgi:inactivated superfamily I helicase/RecB family exonuclease